MSSTVVSLTLLGVASDLVHDAVVSVLLDVLA